MKTLIAAAILLIPFLNVNAQEIGELAPPKPPEVFPPNAFGMDIMFSEGGFGLGTFFRHRLNPTLTVFSDFSISEAKDEREFQYVDYYGNTYTIGKKNRVFLFPINFGAQYRLFRNEIYDNLRPYVNAGIGPTFVVTTPYDKEYFNSFGYAKAKVALGGYLGFGANFGLDKSSLVGLNIRYYIVHMFDGGVESLAGKFRNDIGGVYLTINLGIMY